MKCTNRRTTSHVEFAVALLVCWTAQSASAGPCVQVTSNYVKAGDLQQRLREFRELDPEQTLGRAPAPGIVRVLRVRELNAFLRSYSTGNRLITDPSASICVERQAAALPAAEVLAAVRRTFDLAGREVSVDLLDFSKHVAGSGRLNFPIASLPSRAAGSDSVVWRGWHVAEDGSRIAVWARVRLSEAVQVLTATRELAAGATITFQDIDRKVEQRFPNPGMPKGPPKALEGWVLRKAVRAGALIGNADIEAPILVRRGDAVDLLIAGENVGMRVTAKAESTARAGQRVAVTTALSKKVVQAQVQEKGRAILHVSGAKNAH